MKYSVILIGLLVAAQMIAASPDIEIEVRFIEIRQTLSGDPNDAWQLDAHWEKASSRIFESEDMTDLPSAFRGADSVDLLSAPKIRTKSGTNATIKVVTEYIYPTKFEIRHVSKTNNTDIISGVAIVPDAYHTRDVGITLSVTPVLNEHDNTIALNVLGEIVSEPSWKEYAIPYEGVDGVQKSAPIQFPSFHTRQLNTNLLLYNNSTVTMGGIINTGTKQIVDRIPILGSIPWLGRPFRSHREVQENTHLLITVTARTVDDL